MKDIKKILSDIKKQYFSTADGSLTTDATVTEKEYTLMDGTTKIMISELVVGGVVTIDTKPASEGDYTLEDGTTIKVDAKGIISEITPKAEATDTAAAKKDEPVTPESLQKMAAAFAAGTPEERITNLELLCKAMMEYCFGWQLREAASKAITDQAIATYQSNFDKQEKVIKDQQTTIKNQAIGFSKLVDIVAEVAELPTANSSEAKVKNCFARVTTDAKDEKIKSFSQAFGSLKQSTASR